MSRFFALFQLVGGIILSVGYIPQIRQILKTKSSQGLNFKSFGMIFAGIALYEIYAVALAVGGSGYMYLITNTVSTILSGAMCLLIKLYRQKGNDENENQ